MLRSLNSVLAAAVLITGMVAVPLASPAQEHKVAVTYHDKKNNDDHQWNDHEDQAYKIWQTNTHRKNTVEFDKMKPNDQQTYRTWRHAHTDDSLKINIR